MKANRGFWTMRWVFRWLSGFAARVGRIGIVRWRKEMKTLIVTALAMAVAGPSLAADKCDVPTAQWQPREALQKKLEGEGWKVRSIKTENGCYEAKAVDANGKRLEGVFNPKTLESVGADSDDG
jgi:hypothetical protein